MSSVLFSILNSDLNFQSVLANNPNVADRDLEGLVKCNIIGFTGLVSVQTRMYQFAVGKKEARVIYFTPFKLTDGLVSLKRLLVGVKFQGNKGDEYRITNYVLGRLEINDPNRALAKMEIDNALKEGRRLTIAVTSDDIKIDIEDDQGGCTLL